MDIINEFLCFLNVYVFDPRVFCLIISHNSYKIYVHLYFKKMPHPHIVLFPSYKCVTAFYAQKFKFSSVNLKFRVNWPIKIKGNIII